MNFIIIPEAVHLIGLLIPGVHKTITRQAYSSERTNVAMVFFLFNAYIGMGNDLLYLCACSIILWMSLCISFLLHEMGLANGTWTRQWISHLVLSRIVAPLIITGAFALIRSKTRPATEAQHAIQTMQEKEVEVSGPMTSNTAPAKSKGKEKLSAYEVAMALVASGALEPCPYISDSVEATIQVKIDNREPEDLVTLELRDLLQDSLAKHVHPDVSILNIYTRR